MLASANSYCRYENQGVDTNTFKVIQQRRRLMETENKTNHEQQTKQTARQVLKCIGQSAVGQ